MRTVGFIAAAAFGLATPLSAQADTLSLTLTADNAFSVYVSTNDSQIGTLVGTNLGQDAGQWAQSFSYNFNLNTADSSSYYVHVIGTNYNSANGRWGYSRHTERRRRQPRRLPGAVQHRWQRRIRICRKRHGLVAHQFISRSVAWRRRPQRHELDAADKCCPGFWHQWRRQYLVGCPRRRHAHFHERLLDLEPSRQRRIRGLLHKNPAAERRCCASSADDSCARSLATLCHRPRSVGADGMA